ncbi:MAG: hypothetical protein JNK49_11395 [Planctomycetes bacterium]|nr:hypothetical protein [Planctomycetota bacterium]
MMLRTLLLLSCFVPMVAAQQTNENWSLRLPFVQSGAATALHPVTGRPVRFGGFNTSIGSLPHLWEWDGGGWLRRAAINGPSSRTGHATTRHLPTIRWPTLRGS